MFRLNGAKKCLMFRAILEMEIVVSSARSQSKAVFLGRHPRLNGVHFSQREVKPPPNSRYGHHHAPLTKKFTLHHLPRTALKFVLETSPLRLPHSNIVPTMPRFSIW